MTFCDIRWHRIRLFVVLVVVFVVVVVVVAAAAGRECRRIRVDETVDGAPPRSIATGV